MVNITINYTGISVDGLDVWPIINGENATTPHEEIHTPWCMDNAVGAIIMGDYKLIVNKQPDDCDHLMWSPLDYPCCNRPTSENCDPYYNGIRRCFGMGELT